MFNFSYTYYNTLRFSAVIFVMFNWVESFDAKFIPLKYINLVVSTVFKANSFSSLFAILS